MSKHFPHLFSPLKIGGITIKNRICSTGHDTTIPKNGIPSDALIAYHRARAQGGAGLIIVQVAGVHETARYTSHLLMVTNDDCIPGYKQIVQACHDHGCKVFGQLFHPGREIMESQDGSAPVAFSASSTPNERFHVMPRRMSKMMIDEIVAGYGDGAQRLKRAGLDGVEIVASHGYLPSQFLNPRVNVREDEYGGSLENRVRFLRDVIECIRNRVGDMVVGVRISADEMEHGGLMPAEVTEICTLLDDDGKLDYFSVVAGSSASLAGAIHIVPPMPIEQAYVARFAAAIRARVSKPVMVAGRITQPQIAEQLIAGGQADVCGMTRAMICDPELANKARDGRIDDIRACIGCNQACIGHFHAGYPISCIQHPETGRELEYGRRERAEVASRVMVVGGGPGGMKAAAVAAECGHRVTLYEKESRLGGQALLAQLLPGRTEFGGIVTNLTRELELAGVEVVKGTEVTADLVRKQAPDMVILATGAVPHVPDSPGIQGANVVNAWQVLRSEVAIGGSVVVADWRCDWIGLGVAEKLAREGCAVRLCSDGLTPGFRLQQYIRDQWLGVLHRLGVQIIPMVRLAGVDTDTAYFQHITSQEPVMCDNVDTVVLALGHVSVDRLETELEGSNFATVAIGDCLSPRTAEEAVLEGLKAGTAVSRITRGSQSDERLLERSIL